VNPGNRTYRCRTGEVVVAVQNAEQWHALAVCVGRPELAYEGAWEAVRAAAPEGGVAQVLEGMFAEDDAKVWRRRLEAHGVPMNHG
jgi:crotonobetainyl-CoA:carnitine CoA-transferase CaiB-like acyl-CoA transferase